MFLIFQYISNDTENIFKNIFPKILQHYSKSYHDTEKRTNTKLFRSMEYNFTGKAKTEFLLFLYKFSWFKFYILRLITRGITVVFGYWIIERVLRPLEYYIPLGTNKFK